MNRRQLLKLLVSGVVGLASDATLDLDRLLWIPNRKKIFLPTSGGISESQIIAAEYARIIPKIHALFERDDMFYANIAKRDVEIVSSREMRIPLELKPANIDWGKALILDGVDGKKSE